MKYQDEKFDYNLNLFSKKTIQFLHYAWKESRGTYEQEYEIITGIDKYRIFRFFDIVWCYLRYGTPTYNYVTFQFYKLNSRYRNMYLTLRRRMNIIQEKVDYPTYCIFKRKEKFNSLFRSFIKREWVYVASPKEFMTMEDFINKHGIVIAKPVDEHCGIGVNMLTKEDIPAIECIKAKIRDGHSYILEERLINVTELRTINPTSLNTIRVNTFIDKSGEIHILDMALRVGGKDAIVDNLNSGGISYPINKLGFIDKYGMDKKAKRYYYHPSTNTKMIGLDIPEFSEIVRLAKNAAKVCSTARLVGWDIAMSTIGLELIEGNVASSEDVMQLDEIGKYQYIIKNW